MGNEYYRSGEYARTAHMIDAVINALYAHISGAAGDRAFEEHGLTRVAAPPEMDRELCLAAHHRRLVTQREHVWHVLGDSSRALFGRVRLHQLDSGNKLGEPVVSIVVRYDGFASFDGSIDVDTPITQHGYENVMLDRLARAAMMAIHASLAQVK
ncbi:hypothetical protein [Caballeronia sp. DA-9]|uniref:hypothetical protein n=1 Tax=Caballeronia sp. DA-9 TaxID=3436237 RepID=UPI003F66436B